MDVAIEEYVTLLNGWGLNSDINKDLKCKMKAKTKDLSFKAKDIDINKKKVLVANHKSFCYLDASSLLVFL